MIRLFDGLVNVVSKLGLGKAAANTYAYSFTTPLEINEAYRSSWLGKVINIKAEDTVREWRNWIAEKPQIQEIENEEKRLNVRAAIMQADKWSMLRGGAAIVMGLPGNPASAVNLDSIGKGALKYLAVMTSDQITPRDRVTDPANPLYGGPAMYQIRPEKGAVQEVHPSRVIRFIGQDKPDEDLQWTGWGDPIWHSLKSAISNADAISAGIAEMVQEAKVDVWGIPGLMESLATEQYESILIKRMEMNQRLKSIVNGVVMDAGDSEGKGGETYEQKTLAFAGLPDIQDRAWMELSGKSDIPQTRMLGRAPQGMNSTGDSDAKNYAAMVKARQELKIQPTIAPLDEVLIRSALGSRPAEIWYQWRSLYQISEKEGAEVEKIYAEGLSSRMNTGAFQDEVLAKAELNRMVESGRYPGIEDAIGDAENEGITDPDEKEESELARMQAEAEIAAANVPKRVAANDAEPRTLYVRRDVVNKAEIVKWARAQGFEKVMDDLHVTITYSREAVDWMQMGTSWSPKLEIAPGGPRLMDKFGDATVLLLTADELVWRHDEMIRKGASWDHPEYQPHITISYSFAGDVETIEPYKGKIVLGPEIFEEINDDYRSSISEK